MSSAVSNISGHYKTANGATLSTGQVICGDVKNVISDIKSVELTISQDIYAITNTINNAISYVTNAINTAEGYVATVINTAINYEQEAVSYVTNAVFSEVKTIEGKITALLPKGNFCGLFSVHDLPKDLLGISQYYTIPNINVALNYLNPESSSVIRPLPSQGDQQIGQTQVNRLARGEELSYTDLYRKTSSRVKYIPGPFYNSYWSEPVSSYNGDYPTNHVFKTPNGIIVEHDDTPGAIRIHNYHPSGSYNEINNTGRTVVKSADDHFEIVMKDKNVYIKGALNLTVESGVNVMIIGNVNMDVAGNIQAAVRGDLNAVVSGNTLFNTANNTILKSNNIIVEANNYTLISNNITEQSNTHNIKTDSVNIDVSKDFLVKSDTTTFDSSALNLSSGSISAPKSWIDNGGNDPASPPLLVLGSTTTTSVKGLNSTPPTNITAPQYPVAAPLVSNAGEVVQQHIHNNLHIKQVIYFDSTMPQVQVPSKSISVPPSHYQSKYSSGSAQNINGSVAPLNIDTSILNNDNIKLTSIISKNCTLGAVTKYAHVTHDFMNVSVIPKLQIAQNLMYLTQNCIDPLIDNFGRGSVIIASGYQNYNGQVVTDHNLGNAVDIQFNDIPYEQYQQRIVDISKLIPFDKIIFCWAWNGDEYIPWVHISLQNGQPPGYQSFSYDISHGQYTTGIQNPFNVINTQSTRTDGINA